MSRNKDIEVLHIISKEPYSVCRRKMKEAHWDLTRAVIGNDFFDKFDSVHKAIVKAVLDLNEGLKTAFEAVAKSLGPLIEAYNDSKRCPYCKTSLIDPWFVNDYCPYCGEWFNKDVVREEEINEDLGNHPI